MLCYRNASGKRPRAFRKRRSGMRRREPAELQHRQEGRDDLRARLGGTRDVSRKGEHVVYDDRLPPRGGGAAYAFPEGYPGARRVAREGTEPEDFSVRDIKARPVYPVDLSEYRRRVRKVGNGGEGGVYERQCEIDRVACRHL